jgi:hypothetical protein
MADVVHTITADASGANMAYAELARQVVNLEQRLERTSQTSARSSDTWARGLRVLKEQNDTWARGLRVLKEQQQTQVQTQQSTGAMTGMLNTQLGSLARMYLSWQTIQKGIDLARGSLEEYHRIQDTAAGTQRNVAGGQAESILAMTGRSPAETLRMLGTTEGIAKRTHFPDLAAAHIAAARVWESGGGSSENVASLIEGAFQLTRHQPTAAPGLASSASDIMKATHRKSAKDIYGFLLGAGAEARVEGLVNTTDWLAPAVLQGAKSVPNQDASEAVRQTAAMFAAATQLTADKTGRPTGHFVREMNNQLQTFFTTGKEVTLGGRTFSLAPPKDPGTIYGRLEALQNDATLRGQFLKTATFEERYKDIARHALERGSEFNVFRDKAYANLGFGSGPYDERVKLLEGGTPALRRALAENVGQANTQAGEMAMDREARYSTVRQIVSDTLAHTPYYSKPLISPQKYLPGMFPGARAAEMIGQFISPLAFDRPIAWGTQALADFAGAEPEAAGLQLLKARRGQILGTASGGKLSAKGQRDLSFVDSQIAALVEMASRQTTALEEMNERGKQPAPTAAAAARMERGGHSER